MEMVHKAKGKFCQIEKRERDNSQVDVAFGEAVDKTVFFSDVQLSYLVCDSITFPAFRNHLPLLLFGSHSRTGFGNL